MAKREKSKRIRRTYESLLGTILIITGVVLLGFWGLHKYLLVRSLTLSVQHTLQFASQAPPVSYPSSIRIGNLINVPVAPAGYVNGTWLISEKAANHVTKSASPGEKGNIIIYAHNTPGLFGPLNRAAKGDMVTVTTKNGDEHRYRIIEITTVAPSNTTLLLPSPIELLTLYTCTGFLDSKRLVVRAQPVTSNVE